MALSATSKNAMLDAWAALITHLGLANSGNEVNSGGVYARQAVAWGAAAAGAVAISAPVVFDVDGGNTINEVLVRDSATIDDNTPDYGSVPVTAESFGGDGTYTLNTLTVTLADA